MGQRMYQDIEELLEDSTAAHLSSCLDLIPGQTLDAILAMVQQERRKNTRRSVIRHQVVQDVAAIVSGNIDTPLYCEPYLRPGNREAQVCSKCGNNSAVLNKVSIPNIDFTHLCPDCCKTMDMHQNFVGIL